MIKKLSSIFKKNKAEDKSPGSSSNKEQTIQISFLIKVDASSLGDINNLLRQLSDKARQLNEKELRRIISQSNYHVLVARIPKGQIVAMIGLGIYETMVGKTAKIEDFVVDVRYQGNGWGKRILESCILLARRKGAIFIDLTSNPQNPKRAKAIHLYQKAGFKEKEGMMRLDL